MSRQSGYGMRPGIILLREGTDTSQVSPASTHLAHHFKICPYLTCSCFVVLLCHVPYFQQQPQGKPQLIANINACQAVAETIRTTLGPAGRDKLIATNRVTIRYELLLVPSITEWIWQLTFVFRSCNHTLTH
jgi:hypothetical protein